MARVRGASADGVRRPATRGSLSIRNVWHAVWVDADVTLFGAEWCPDCRRTKRALDAAGVPYVYRDLEADPAAADEAQSISGRMSIPVVVLPDGVVLVEPSDADLTAAIEAADIPGATGHS
jgi:mycoredoxin